MNRLAHPITVIVAIPVYVVVLWRIVAVQLGESPEIVADQLAIIIPPHPATLRIPVWTEPLRVRNIVGVTQINRCLRLSQYISIRL